MDFEVHCMSILHIKLSFFNCDKVKSVLQSITPLILFFNNGLQPNPRSVLINSNRVHRKIECVFLSDQDKNNSFPPREK